MRELIECLERDWMLESGHHSNPTLMKDCNSYREIVAMGAAAIPAILQIIKTRESLLIWALHDITGINPVAPKHAGRLDKMTGDWLRWGQENNHLCSTS